MLAKVVSIDEEFQKGRGPDKKPRKRRGEHIPGRLRSFKQWTRKDYEREAKRKGEIWSGG